MSANSRIVDVLHQAPARVLLALLEGHVSSNDIGSVLGTTECVVKLYFQKVYDAIGVTGRAELVLWSIAHPEDVAALRTRQGDDLMPSGPPRQRRPKPVPLKKERPRMYPHTNAPRDLPLTIRIARYLEIQKHGPQTFAEQCELSETHGMLQALHPKHKAVLLLRAEGLKVAAIAERMGTSKRTVDRICSAWGIAPLIRMSKLGGRPRKVRADQVKASAVGATRKTHPTRADIDGMVKRAPKK